MDIKALDKALQEIQKKRSELEKIDYNNPKYDDLEEQLHDLEDAFQVQYGEFVEDALQDVHDELCPDNDVLMPVAYLGKGIPVEVDKYPGKDTKLTIETNPPRIILLIGKDKQETVWTAE
jgi:predicted nuclease with TOPRIM domain